MPQFIVPTPDLQISFHRRLQELRSTYLLEALLNTVSESDILRIDEELRSIAPAKALQKVAGWGLRGEVIFPVPYVLHQNPTLLGYYRLLLGFSQKEFYGDDYGFKSFKPLEVSGKVKPSQETALNELCITLCLSAERFVAEVSTLTTQALHDLTLLTLGAQLRGGALNRYGARATKKVFELIKEIVEPAIVSSTEQHFEVMNAAGRTVRIEFSPDPDISIRELLASGKPKNLVAIEIKGGTDVSNIHNRLGEAEKSHQKAKKDGFVECWTIVGVSKLDLTIASHETPTTDRFYNIKRIGVSGSEEHADFGENLRSIIGIRD